MKNLAPPRIGCGIATDTEEEGVSNKTFNRPGEWRVEKGEGQKGEHPTSNIGTYNV